MTSWEVHNPRTDSWVNLPKDVVYALDSGLRLRSKPCIFDYNGVEYRADFDNARALCTSNPHKFLILRRGDGPISPSHVTSPSLSRPGTAGSRSLVSPQAPYATSGAESPERELFPSHGKRAAHTTPSASPARHQAPAAAAASSAGGSRIPFNFPADAVRHLVEEAWAGPQDDGILGTLMDYIEVPSLSPVFDAEWNTNGLQETALDLIVQWLARQDFTEDEMNYRIIKEDDRTPTLVIEFPSTLPGSDNTGLLYGHYDKQPPFTGWDEGLGPYTAVIRDGKLYGRGGADDGYAAFAAVTAIRALKQVMNQPHPRYVVLVEGAEESGSRDLPFYITQLKPWLGKIDFILCLDSGAGDYERMWLTTSLRGAMNGLLRVSHITEGVHSGMASGMCPDSSRIARLLLDRLEDPATGQSKVKSLNVPPPAMVKEQAKRVASAIGGQFQAMFPLQRGAVLTSNNLEELYLSKAWHPTMTVIGASGLPAADIAGNVLRPETNFKLSFRLPPTANVNAVVAEVKQIVETAPPYGAAVAFESDKSGGGWNAFPAQWLEETVGEVSKAVWGKEALQIGEGGSIPFMGMLKDLFPTADFCVTGVLGPHSNAHGPNEFLHIEYTKKLNVAIAGLLAQHSLRSARK